ncbi:MAG: LysR family transcriptional regulator [Azospirillaceae bacterium]|nr:LysR family transcriptional regulator [Azospirillaceae bacterium]
MIDINRLDIDLLLAFEALLIDSNVTKAAARLNLRQPALSARLARLREVFDDRLFIPAPNGRGVLPTPRALALQPLLSAVLTNLNAMVQSSGDFDPTTSSRIFTLALHENPAVMLAPDLIPRVQALAPGVRLVLRTPDKPRVAELLESGEVDLYIGVGTHAHDAWHSRTLFADDFAVGQRKQHPRGCSTFSLDAYCAHDHLLVSSEGPPFHGFVDTALAAIGRSRRVGFSVQNYAVAPTIIAASDLLCTLPRRFLSRYAASLDLFEPPVAVPPAEVAAFWHPRHHEDAGHRWLREQLFRAGASVYQD